MNAITITDVSKRFTKQSFQAGQRTFLSWIVRDLWRSFSDAEKEKKQFVALNGVSFEVPKGSTFGIIGRNGSGKSTLLKMIHGVLSPNDGEIIVHGRKAALLELGAGFHPELTGYENIIINGIVLGKSRKEILAIIDEIIGFAELEEFIHEPIRTYSTGMVMRLGFSVATHVDADLLIIDECLAVGDAMFTQKCLARFEQFKNEGKTLLIVSHDASFIEKHCDHVVWLHKGNLASEGHGKENVSKVVNEYLNHTTAPDTEETLAPTA